MPSLVIVAQFPIFFPRDFAWKPATTDLYVTTRGGIAVIKLDWTTSVQTPSADVTLSSHIVFDGTDFWVDDGATALDGNVRAYNPALSPVATVNTLTPGPTFLTFDGVDIFAANPNGSYVSKLNLGGLIANIGNGGSPPTLTSSPLVAALGDIWFVNATAGAFHFRNLSGSVHVVLAGVSSATDGLCFDGTNFWYSDVTHNALVKISPAGTILGSFPVVGIPGSLFFGGGFLWLATITSQSVQVWTLAGTLVTICNLIGFGEPIFVTLAGSIPFVSIQGGAFSGILQLHLTGAGPTGGAVQATFTGFFGPGHIGGGTI